MSDVIINLLPVMLAATLAPLYPIIVLLLLQSQGGLLKASAFVTGNVAVRLVQGILFGFIFGAAAAAYPDDGPQIIASTLLLILGILLLIAAFMKWRKEEDPDAPPPKWMAAIGGLTPLRALGAGALFVVVVVKQWVFTLTAIDIIEGANLGRSTSIGLYLLYLVATQTLVLIPLVASAIAPKQAAKPLQAAQAWLERNNRVITVTVSLIFGLLFLYQGITGLIGY